MRDDSMPEQQGGSRTMHCYNDKRTCKREPGAEQAMIPTTIILRCIANCLETSRYYVSKGNRPLADWWHERANMYADNLASDKNY